MEVYKHQVSTHNFISNKVGSKVAIIGTETCLFGFILLLPVSTEFYVGTRDVGTSVALMDRFVQWNNILEGPAVVTTCSGASVSICR